MADNAASRTVRRVVKGMPTSDGAGVKLRRVIGQPQLPELDPFLMLDEFGTDRAEDYIAGFPDHPHRGFETVTYMLDGRMRHRDNHGNEGVLVPGSVQWMTAGRGLVHSEMPEQQEGRMRGFQLWLNLPAREKMTAPKYQEFGPARIPIATPAPGVTVKVIAGKGKRHERTDLPAGHRPDLPRHCTRARRRVHAVTPCRPRGVPVCIRGRAAGWTVPGDQYSAHARARSPRRRHRHPSARPVRGRGWQGGACNSGRRPAVTRTGRQVRTLRHEHPGGVAAGLRGFSTRSLLSSARCGIGASPAQQSING
jgi:redox-sensitive bicupin YhaK (pirin superfamily)